MLFLIFFIPIVLTFIFFSKAVSGDEPPENHEKRQNFHKSYDDDDSDDDLERRYENYYLELHDAAESGDKQALEEIKNEFGDDWESDF